MQLLELSTTSKGNERGEKKEKSDIVSAFLLLFVLIWKHRSNSNLSTTLKLHLFPSENKTMYFSQQYLRNQKKKKNLETQKEHEVGLMAENSGAGFCVLPVPGSFLQWQHLPKRSTPHYTAQIKPALIYFYKQRPR